MHFAPTRQFFTPIILMMLSASVMGYAAPATAAGGIDINNEDYQYCYNRVSINPREALKFAKKWRRRSRSESGAVHCQALAYFALKQSENAAKSLDTLYDMMTESDATQRVGVRRQAARAWLKAGNPEKAFARINDTLEKILYRVDSHPTMARMAVELLMERSNIFAEAQMLPQAVQDLDHAETLGQLTNKVRLKRAEAYMYMQNFELAEHDVEAVLREQPGHSPAQLMLKRIVDESSLVAKAKADAEMAKKLAEEEADETHVDVNSGPVHVDSVKAK